MKALWVVLSVMGSLILAGQANAADAKAAEALALRNGCSACHSISVKIVGPSYKDIAARYKNDKSAEAKLIKKVKEGGSGVWGPNGMPANSPHVKDEDIKTVVQWVLSL